MEADYLWIFIWYCFTWVNISQGEFIKFVVDRENEQLTEVPTDVPENVTDLLLGFNEIREVNDITAYTDITNLRLNNNLLTEFPNVCKVNATLQWLTLLSNEMSFINSERLGCLGNLKALYMQYNKLTYIPPLTNLVFTLIRITLGKNPLIMVPRLDMICPNLEQLSLSDVGIEPSELFAGLNILALKKLKSIWLGQLYLNVNNINMTVFRRLESLIQLQVVENEFVSLPDLSFCKETLQILNISLNPILYINIGHLKQFPVLRRFACIGCKLTTVPNACMINNNPPLVMNLENNPFICDYRSKWLIPARDAGAVTFSGNPCSAPDRLTGFDVTDLQPSYFDNTEEKKMFLNVESIQLDNYRCSSYVKETNAESGLTLQDCIVSCINTAECIAVGYHYSNKSCHFIEAGSGFVSFSSLYIVN